MASVIGIIGYTHGVSDVRKPKPNAARYIHSQPLSWYSPNASVHEAGAAACATCGSTSIATSPNSTGMVRRRIGDSYFSLVT